MYPSSRLNTRLLVGGKHELIAAQRLAIPDPLVKIQDPSCLEGKLRIAGEDPTAVLPRPDRILVEPAPNGAVTDRGNQSHRTRLPCHVGHTQARQRHLLRCRRLTGQRLDLDDHVWGKKPGVAPGALDPPIPAGVLRRTACATGSRFRGAYAGTRQSRHCLSPWRREGSSWRALPDNTVTYIWPRVVSVRDSRRVRARYDMDSALALDDFAALTMPTMPQRVLTGNLYT